MKKIAIFSMFYIFIFNCNVSASEGEYEKCLNNYCPSTKVSIIELISNGKNYNNKSVYITGFVQLEHEGNAVFLSRDDYLYSIFKNSLWLDLSKKDGVAKECKESFCSIQGIYNHYDKGHLGLFSGAIKEITRMKIKQVKRDTHKNLSNK